MSPRRVRYSREVLLEGALEQVRSQGLERMSARTVAARLGASVAPVYNVFHSMEGLTRAVLEEVVRRLEAATRQTYTEMPFLNIGVGMVVFARDEPGLYRALFHARHGHMDLIDRFMGGILKEMKRDPWLRQLPDQSLRRLLGNIRLYTHGLAAAVIYGWFRETDTDSLIRELRNLGNVLIFAEVAEITDCRSQASLREWRRILEERGFSLPGPGGPGEAEAPGKGG